MARIFR